VALHDDSGRRRLYASQTHPGTWMAGAGLVFGIIVFVAVVPLDGLWITVFAVAAMGMGIFAFGTARRKVVYLTRYGDELSVELTGGRTFRAPVDSFSGWRHAEFGRASAINFTWRGQRYVLPTLNATLIDPEGFGELSPDLGRALAGRWNAQQLRPR
jgi:hypothetical protein